MGSPLYGKISSACKAAAKRKFKVWPSAYASGWGVRCTKAGGPSKFGNKKKKQLWIRICLLYTSPSPRDRTRSRMPSSA